MGTAPPQSPDRSGRSEGSDRAGGGWRCSPSDGSIPWRASRAAPRRRRRGLCPEFVLGDVASDEPVSQGQAEVNSPAGLSGGFRVNRLDRFNQMLEREPSRTGSRWPGCRAFPAHREDPMRSTCTFGLGLRLDGEVDYQKPSRSKLLRSESVTVFHSVARTATDLMFAAFV